MDSAQALIIIALRAKAVENAVDHLQPKAVTVVTSQESLEGCSTSGAWSVCKLFSAL